MTYLLLYWEFFKVGLFSIGGGLATLPFLYQLSATHPMWLGAKDIADMIAVSESTPGPIGINMATYAGYQAGGVLGGIVATLGEVSPSIIIIVLIAKFLTQFDKKPKVKDAFYGLRAAVIGLISFAALKLASVTLMAGSQPKIMEIGLYGVMLLLVLRFKNIHPFIWILASAVLGIVLQLPS